MIIKGLYRFTFSYLFTFHLDQGHLYHYEETFAIRGHSFSTYTKFSEKLTFLTPDTHTDVYVLGGKKCYSENFAYVLNG